MSATKLPKIIDFPPLYTKQLSSKIQQEQLEHWKTIILLHYSNKKEYVIDLEEIEQGNIKDNVFNNRRIQRKLSTSFLQEILQYMVKQKVLIQESDVRYLVLWRSLSGWANLIYQWVDYSAQQNKTFLILDLLDDDEYEDSVFFGLHPTIFKLSLKLLEKENKAKLFTQNNVECVKFN